MFREPFLAGLRASGTKAKLDFLCEPTHDFPRGAHFMSKPLSRNERDDGLLKLEIPMERAGYRWRYYVGGIFGFFGIVSLVGTDREGWGLLGALVFWLPISISFLLSAVAIQRDWEYGLFFRILPAGVILCFVAGVTLLGC